MPAEQPVPSANAVRSLLGQLLDGAVTVKKGAPVVPGPKTPSIVALYARDDGFITSAWISDISFGARLGAALTRIPASTAESFVKRGTVEEMVFENFCEVMNVGTGVFTIADSPHLKMLGVYLVPKAKTPDAAAALLSKPSARLDLEVEVLNYGSGRMSILVA